MPAAARVVTVITIVRSKAKPVLDAVHSRQYRATEHKGHKKKDRAPTNAS